MNSVELGQDEDRGDEIAELASRIDAAQHRLLTMIRVFDEKQHYWTRYGATSCAHWLSWRLGMSPATAREKVRVARALGRFPLIDAAFSKGEISYSKVRAITRIATRENEAVLLGYAHHGTGAILEKICRMYRKWVEPRIDGVEREDLDDRYVTSYTVDCGMQRIVIQLLADEAAIVLQALDSVRFLGNREVRKRKREREKEGTRQATHEAGVSTESPSSTKGVAARSHAEDVDVPAEALAAPNGEDGKLDAEGADVSVEATSRAGAAASLHGGQEQVFSEIQPASDESDRRPREDRAHAFPDAPFRPNGTRAGEEGLLEGTDAIDFSRLSESSLAGWGEGARGEFARPTVRSGFDRVDALVALASSALEAGAVKLPASSHRFEVVVNVDAAALRNETETLATLEPGSTAPPEMARRIACDAAIVEMEVDENGEALSVGRRRRSIPPSIRRALRRRDKGCRFPSCTNTSFVDGHHIVHWADGGETKLDDLVLLCRHHHRLVHEQGFRVEMGGEGVRFFTPEGEHLPDVFPPSGPGERHRYESFLSWLEESGVEEELEGYPLPDTWGWDLDMAIHGLAAATERRMPDEGTIH